MLDLRKLRHFNKASERAVIKYEPLLTIQLR